MSGSSGSLDQNGDSESQLLLASTSPRRVEILKNRGYAFEAIPPGVEESEDPHLTALELSLLNAKRKACAVSAFSPYATVIGADTVVVIDGVTLGKPKDLGEAKSMVTLLGGRTHKVLTSVWIQRWLPYRVTVFTEVSEVTFHPLTPSQIDDYLAKIHPLDKAGAYAAQEYREEIIARIDGTLSNVIGLPIESVERVLRDFGILIASQKATTR